MSTILKQLINKKLRQLSSEDLLRYAHQYGFSINRNQAKEITAYMHENPINPFEYGERMKMFKELARITDEKTADKAQK